MTAAPSPPDPPDIPGLAPEGWLGRGGFADVFLYSQSAPSRRVAVKVLRDTSVSPAAVAPFRAEADAMARLEPRTSSLSSIPVRERAHECLRGLWPDRLRDRRSHAVRSGKLGCLHPLGSTRTPQRRSPIERPNRCQCVGRHLVARGCRPCSSFRPSRRQLGRGHSGTHLPTSRTPHRASGFPSHP